MRVVTSKSKNAESFYISKGYVNDKGVSTSVIVRKLGTLKELLPEHGPTRDDVMAWAKEQARIETLKYKQEKEEKQIKLTFHAGRLLDYHKQTFFRGGYLFLQFIYYQMQMNKICRKLKQRYKFKYDINAILSDLIYARILEPCSKRSSYKAASEFLEKPSYELHDIYRALDVLGAECDMIQAEVYKNSHFMGERNDKILYYDCSNYYFEIEQEDGSKKYGKSKEHRPNPIIQMGLFMDGDGIPLAFSLFPGNANEQTSLKPLEKKVLGEFGCQKFIYCSDAGLGSESIREYNHMGERAYIVTQSIKKLKKEEKEWALSPQGFKRVSDDKPVDITKLPEDDKGLYYKDEPYTTQKLHQRLIITYSPKYALYQKSIRDKQVERAQKILDSGNAKKNRKNPNDPARFIGKMAVTKDGEAANIKQYLDEDKIADEAQYDGLYAVCTDLLDDGIGDILKVSEGRWQIEECFRIMKTDFSARPVYLRDENRVKAHFLICFLALTVYRYLEKKLDSKYTCEELLDTLKAMNFAGIQEQGFIPLYRREKITDDLHEACGFRTDYQFITKSKMRTIQKKSKGKE
ncbi:IS1634 family transposase [Mediterraneibacter glycyrrhizinilyticus]|uniref:IS1634 family transposase n=1 Tax=Mediterraneibacter glycyrrhizinilyticus TaxID=342942 RepID=UPI0025AACA87|nr:IS1634 family transposase [Mediterraneibacter glycyrrhizinilyticus]MDN0043278.1 IS1634 family transposase [Mediterraneibacter glycyrrhizinilyticus]